MAKDFVKRVLFCCPFCSNPHIRQPDMTTIALPFTPTRPVPIIDDAESTVSLSFPRIGGAAKTCGAVAVITFDAPKTLNAVTFDDLMTFYTLLEWLDEQPAVSITVLTGKGRLFSAGANVADPARADVPREWTDYPADHVKHINSKRVWAQARVASANGTAARLMMQHSKLTVAAMNGPVIGIMAAIVALCDLIYTYDNFYLLTPFSQLALVAEAGSTVSFPAKVGRRRTGMQVGRRSDFHHGRWVSVGLSKRSSRDVRCPPRSCSKLASSGKSGLPLMPLPAMLMLITLPILP